MTASVGSPALTMISTRRGFSSAARNSGDGLAADEVALRAVLVQQRVGLGDRPVVQRHGVAVVGEVARDVRAHHGQAGDPDLCGADGGLRIRRSSCRPFRFELWHSMFRSDATRLAEKSRCSSVSQGTATAMVGTTSTATAREVGGRREHRRCWAARPAGAPARTVVGPPAASAPDGVRPDAQATSARARGVGPAARTAASSASSSISSRTASSALALRTKRGKAACTAVKASSTRS